MNSPNVDTALSAHSCPYDLESRSCVARDVESSEGPLDGPASGVSSLEDDPELLRAALAIVDSWDEPTLTSSITIAWTSPDGLTGASVGSGDEVQPPPSLDSSGSDHVEAAGSSGLKPATKASTLYKRREEIAYLKRTVVEMEAQVAALAPVRPEASASKIDELDPALNTLWRELAGSQRRLRQRAELDQMKLRSQLDAQVQVSRELLKLMNRARRLHDNHDGHSVVESKRARPNELEDHWSNEANDLAHIERLYDDIESAFSFHKFQDGTLQFVDLAISDDHQQIVVEFREAWTLPFAPDRVLDALWQFMQKKVDAARVPSDHLMNTTISSDGDLVVCRCTVTSTAKGLEATGQGCLMFKRFHACGDRPSAIITTMETGPSRASPGALDGILSRDDASIRLLPLPSSCAGGEIQSGCQVQIVQRVAIRFQKSVATSRATAGAISKLVLKMIKDDVERKHEMVETVLLQRSGSSQH